jgi:polyisoprenoid-binding protein YceI
MQRLTFRLGSTFLAAAFLSVALAADGGLNIAKSTVISTFKQENVPVDAPFKKFSGTIKYDAANPGASSASITVDMASLDIGDEGYNAEVRKPSWFDSAHFPQGTFVSTSIKAGTAGHFDATGTLTVKGKAAPVTVAITYQHVGATDTFDGGFDLSRKALGIGDPSWEDVLDDKVHVRFHLVNGGT